ncbi:WD40-repeat-containing domain protein [Phycomyces nitens]|nr:WD40-repeat-containing domain protein [Phycomyces nitens]
MAHDLSDYEKQRLKNIEDNAKLLNELHVPFVGQKRSASSTLKKHTPKKKIEPKTPTRVSARLRGAAPDTTEALTMENEERSQKIIRVDRLGEADQEDFLRILKSFPNTQPTVKEETETKDNSDLKVSEALKALQIRHSWQTVKVVTERITNCVFHPSPGKLLGCVADVIGQLGFWDIEGVKEAEDGDEPVVYKYRPHTRSITDMKFSPVDSTKLYTSSYDGTVQYFDMEKAVFTEVSLGDDSLPLTSMTITQDGHSVWIATSDGEVGHKDLRSNSALSLYSLRTKKIGTIDLNDVHKHLLAVSSNDRTATVWDTRNFSTKKAITPLHELEHGYAVTSAYWSPRGDRLATTSYDDFIRLFTVKNDAMSLHSAIPHNNHTGKWVTNFRARWNASPMGQVHQHMAIGNMKHPVNIYSGETGKIIGDLYDSERITAVPAVVQFHPTTTSMAVLCGNGSGRMVCWT